MTCHWRVNVTLCSMFVPYCYTFTYWSIQLLMAASVSINSFISSFSNNQRRTLPCLICRDEVYQILCPAGRMFVFSPVLTPRPVHRIQAGRRPAAGRSRVCSGCSLEGSWWPRQSVSRHWNSNWTMSPPSPLSVRLWAMHDVVWWAQPN